MAARPLFPPCDLMTALDPAARPCDALARLSAGGGRASALWLRRLQGR